MAPQSANSRGRAVELRDRAKTGAFAGFGNLAASIRTERHDGIEFLEDITRTRFHDDVRILGEPESWIPIGAATFSYLVEGDFDQPFGAQGVNGRSNMSASFEAVALSADHASMGRHFPSLIGPQRQPVFQLLSVEILFVIGEEFSIRATLDGFATERKQGPPDSRLGARLSVSGTLQPIIVTGVESPQIVAASGTQYSIAPDTRTVKLLMIGDQLLRH